MVERAATWQVPGLPAPAVTGAPMRKNPATSGWRAAGYRSVSPVIFKTLAVLFSGLEAGSIRVVLPGGHAHTFAGRRPGPAAELHIHTSNFVWRTLRRGTIGFAEGYFRDECDTPDLGELFRFFVLNKPALKAAGRGQFKVRRADTLFHRGRSNTLEMSPENISFHYDLGNDFYSRWLDETMTYSSAYFTGTGQSLADAQVAKYNRIMNGLSCDGRPSILEIGCGWGGFAETASKRGADVLGLTLSREQLNYANARLQSADLGERSTCVLRDYREANGSYDAIVSIEMIEAVGAEHWGQYFSTVRDRLKPGGRAGIQAITISDELYPTYSSSPDFIQRYIFPGGMLPTVSALRDEAAKAGLRLLSAEHFADSYARTLWLWRSRFRSAWRDIEQMGFDRRFFRMWDYYLTYCAVGFEQRTIDVGIYAYEKPA